MKIDIELTICCACGEDLYQQVSVKNGSCVIVDPCKQCLNAMWKSGHESGHKDGHADGYREGVRDA